MKVAKVEETPPLVNGYGYEDGVMENGANGFGAEEMGMDDGDPMVYGMHSLLFCL